MIATARDAMTQVVFSLTPETSVTDAAIALGAHGVSGAPVCDAHGRVVGVVSKGDLAEWCVGPRAHAGATVSDAMSTDVLKVPPDASLQSVAEQMVFEGMHRVVVVDNDDTVLGIVVPLDILRIALEGFDSAWTRGSRFASWPIEPAPPRK